jgi:hypothetical protein
VPGFRVTLKYGLLVVPASAGGLLVPRYTVYEDAPLLEDHDSPSVRATPVTAAGPRFVGALGTAQVEKLYTGEDVLPHWFFAATFQ